VVIVHSASKLDYPQWLYMQGQAVLAVNSVDRGLQLLPFTY